MFNVMDLAWFILRRCANNGNPISNLQLQKILYFLQRLFIIEENNGVLFNESIEAWQYGPVIPEVYKNFSFYSATKIIPTNFDPPSDIDIPEYLLNELDRRAAENPWKLVEETHKPGGAWDTIFNNGYGNRNIIPLELIRDEGNR